MDASVLLSQIVPKIPEMMVPQFTDRVKAMPEDKLTSLSAVPMKNPTTAILLAWFLGGLGVDRFYLGQTGSGVAKFLTCGGFGIWWLIDLFTATNRAKQANYTKLMMYM